MLEVAGEWYIVSSLFLSLLLRDFVGLPIWSWPKWWSANVRDLSDDSWLDWHAIMIGLSSSNHHFSWPFFSRFAFQRNLLEPRLINRVPSWNSVNPVNVLYAAFPAYLYLNPNLGSYALKPLLHYQSSPVFPQLYAASDLGMFDFRVDSNTVDIEMYGVSLRRAIPKCDRQ